MNHTPKKQKSMDMTSGSITKLLIMFAVPLVIGNLFQQLYNTVDSLVVGNFVGSHALAAVGSTTSIINMIVMFFTGTSVGAGVVISRYYGAHDDEKLHIAVETTMALTFICGILLTGLGIWVTPYMLEFMSTPEDVLPSASVYLEIYFSGVFGLLVYNMGSAILRAVGDSKKPLYFLIASCLTNIVLDLIFVVCLHLEVAGAALATIMSQLLSATLVMVTLIRTKESYRFNLKELRVEPVLLKKIIKIGLPAGLQSMMYSISNILIQANINGYGTNTIASWAVYGKIDGIFWMTMDAMGISVTTFAGQNFGAGKIKRLKKGTYVGLLMSTIITAALGVFMFTAGPVLISLFTNDVDVMAESMSIIRFLVPFWFCYICVNVYPCTLRGVGDALIPMLIICVGTCILRVLWVFGAGAVHPGLYTTLTSYPLSWTITSLAFLVYYYRFSAMRKLNKLIEE